MSEHLCILAFALAHRPGLDRLLPGGRWNVVVMGALAMPTATLLVICPNDILLSLAIKVHALTRMKGRIGLKRGKSQPAPPARLIGARNTLQEDAHALGADEANR